MSGPEGQCQCGAVKFRINGPLGVVRLCHCLRCRRASGSAFSANARIRTSDFEIVNGRDQLSRYEINDGVHLHFCSVCGSPAFVTVAKESDYIRPRIGGLTGDIDVEVSAHVWTGSKACWYEIEDSLPQYVESAIE